MENNEFYFNNDSVIPGNAKLPNADHPWRRLLARAIDFGFYWVVWYLVAYFVFTWNVTRQILDSVIFAILVMFIIEPFLLRLFATTPGKALLGIRVTDRGGGKLAIFQGFERVLGVLGYGTGFLIIPVYNIYCLCKSYRAYMKSGETEWDEGYDYIVKEGRADAAIAGGILSIVILSAAILMAPYVMAVPIHRGDNITLEQFTENVNHNLLRSQLRHTEALGVRYDGAFGVLAEPARSVTRPSGGTHFVSARRVPPFTVVEADGYLVEIGFTVNSVSRSLHNNFIDVLLYPMFYGFVGAQEEMTALNMAFSDIHRNVDRRRAMVRRGNIEDYSFVVADIEVSMTFSGNFDYGHGSMTFNMRKVS